MADGVGKGGDMLSVLEIAVFALVLSASSPSATVEPFVCVSDRLGGVNCTNGHAASPGKDGNIHFRGGITVIKDRRLGVLRFSNGINARMDSSSWVQFSTGLSSQRNSDGSFRFNNGFVCRQETVDKARCEKAR